MSGPSKSLTFDIFGRDRTASKTMDKVGASAEKTGSRFKASAAIIGTSLLAAGAGIVKFGIDSVKAYAEAQEQQNKLAFAFEKFPALADTNQKALQDLNTELQKKTRFDDDNLAAAQASLAAYGLTGAQLKEITPLLADYAAKTGKDVVDASSDLGKALLGQGRALKDVGIDFVDSGSVADNFKAIIGGLGEKVSGFAEKDASTASGRLDVLKNRFGDVQEEVGEKLMPALETFQGWLEGDGMDAISGAADTLNNDVLPALGKVGDFFNDFEKNTQWFRTLGDTWAAGLSGLGDLSWLWDDKALNKQTDKIVENGGPLGDLFSWTKDWDKGWVDFWGGLSGEAESGMNKIRGGPGQGGMGGGMSAIGLDMDAYRARFGNTWSGSLDDANRETGRGWGSINAASLLGVGNVKSTFGTVSPAVRKSFSDASTLLRSSGENIVLGLERGIGNAAASAVRAAVGVAKSILNSVKDALGIHSPSAEFEWVGSMIGAGLAGGIGASASQVQGALDDLVPDTSIDVVTGSPSRLQQSLSAATVNAQTTPSERPIYADGIGLIGWVRELANGEAQLVWAMSESSSNLGSQMGRQRR